MKIPPLAEKITAIFFRIYIHILNHAAGFGKGKGKKR